jgi:hypothetical protein
VFFGVLKDSSAPEQDQFALGLDLKIAVLANTMAFDPQLPVDIQSPAFREAFFQRINPVRIPWFYLTHPDRGLEKLRISAADAYTLRPPYAGLPARRAAIETVAGVDVGGLGQDDCGLCDADPGGWRKRSRPASVRIQCLL